MSKTPKFLIGKMLGQGAYKTCYELVDDPTRVLVTAPSNYLREYSNLLALQELGLPAVVPECMHERAHFKRPEQAEWRVEKVAILPRMACSSRDSGGDLAMVLNDNTLADLKQMIRVFSQGTIYVGDLQFLFGPDGRCYISDPLSVSAQDPEHHDAKWWKGDIDKIIRGVAYAKHLRATLTSDKGDWFWANARNYWDQQEEPKLQFEAAKMGIATTSSAWDWRRAV